jgi:hypothetical protein
MAHFQMSTGGSKSNEHVDHFLVDIHKKTGLLLRMERSEGCESQIERSKGHTTGKGGVLLLCG